MSPSRRRARRAINNDTNDLRAGGHPCARDYDRGDDENRTQDDPWPPPWIRHRNVIARQVRLGGQLGAHLGQLELQLPQVLDGRSQHGQRRCGRMRRFQIGYLRAQLRGALVKRISPRSVRRARCQLRCALRLRGTVALLGELRVKPDARRARVGKRTPVGLQLRQRGFAGLLLLAQPIHVAAQHLEVARVLRALSLVAPDAVFELLARRVRSAIRTAHRLLKPVPQRALVLRQAGELLVMDARRRAEELFRWQPRQQSDLRLDRRGIVVRLVAQAEIDRPALAGKNLAKGARLAILKEVDLDRRLGVRVAPRAQIVELGRCERRTPEQHHLYGALDC
jgi:hypothetical protein